ncbi:MAG: alpha/beta hydrolase [Fluviibacter phosphoraccumulans]
MLRKFRAPRLAHERTPAALGLEAEVVHIDAADGGDLFGWWIPATGVNSAAKAPTAIVLHGWGANASLMLDIAPWIQSLGFHGLFIDARCHGLSSDAAFTSMPRFAEDLESARAWALGRSDVDPLQVLAIGHSVGAGAVLLSASRSSWAGVISLSAFAHPEDMMLRFMNEHRIPKRRIQPWVMHQVQAIIGARFDDIAPENTIQKVQCPVMLVHGMDDQEVPLAEARRLMAHAPNDSLKHLIPDTGHDLRPAMPLIAPAAIDFMRTLFCDN